MGIQPILKMSTAFSVFRILRTGHKKKKIGSKDRRLRSLESVQTVWITYVVVVIWADKMLLEGSLSSTLFALGSQAEIYYGWKPLQLSDVVLGYESWKYQLKLIAWVVILNICNSCNGKRKKKERPQFCCASMITLNCGEKSLDISGKEKGNTVSTGYLK